MLIPKKRPYRIAYLSGPVDAAEVYETWLNGAQLGYFGTSYISQFYDLCAELGADAYVITTLPGAYRRQKFGTILIENRPPPANLRGARFHIASILWFIRLWPSLLRFGPDVLIATALQNYWFMLRPLILTKTVVIAALHCTLWQKFRPVPRSWKLLLRLNKTFYARTAREIIAASRDIAVQVRALTRDDARRIEVFMPTYARSQFASIAPPKIGARPFRVMFAGRVEINKGVYDLVEIAAVLQARDPGHFQFDICGHGSELEELRQRVRERGLSENIFCHGYCEREQLLAILARSHAVIVPTTTEFEEGFNMVCAEAILTGRPVITSAVCPALEYVREAAVEVPPDDVAAYTQAILDLACDRDLYERKRAACALLQEQFYDPRKSWGATLHEVLARCLPCVETSPRVT